MNCFFSLAASPGEPAGAMSGHLLFDALDMIFSGIGNVGPRLEPITAPSELGCREILP
jgi:hypothetical protein